MLFIMVKFAVTCMLYFVVIQKTLPIFARASSRKTSRYSSGPLGSYLLLQTWKDNTTFRQQQHQIFHLTLRSWALEGMLLRKSWGLELHQRLKFSRRKCLCPLLLSLRTLAYKIDKLSINCGPIDLTTSKLQGRKPSKTNVFNLWEFLRRAKLASKKHSTSELCWHLARKPILY